MSDNHEDNSNTVRVQFSHDGGTVESHANNSGSVRSGSDDGSFASGSGHIGGIHSGGQFQERNAPEGRVNAYTAAPNLGNFTARNSVGDPITSVADLKPDSLVTLPNGMTTLYSVAKENGLLNPGAFQQQGQRQDQLEQDQNQQQQQQQDQNEGDMGKAADAVPMDADSEAVMREALHHDEGAVVQAASDLIDGSGKIGDDLIARFSAAYNCPPEQVHQRVQVALRGYEGDAVRGTARAAHTDESLAFEALQDARNNRRGEFNKAANQHFQTGGTKAYEPIATDFIAGLGTTQPARVLGAYCGPGVSVSQGSDGEVLVTLPQVGTVRYEDAVRQGWISVSSGKGRR
jgi:hypothetical protein